MCSLSKKIRTAVERIGRQNFMFNIRWREGNIVCHLGDMTCWVIHKEISHWAVISHLKKNRQKLDKVNKRHIWQEIYAEGWIITGWKNIFCIIHVQIVNEISEAIQNSIIKRGQDSFIRGFCYMGVLLCPGISQSIYNEIVLQSKVYVCFNHLSRHNQIEMIHFLMYQTDSDCLNQIWNHSFIFNSISHTRTSCKKYHVHSTRHTQSIDEKKFVFGANLTIRKRHEQIDHNFQRV